MFVVGMMTNGTQKTEESSEPKERCRDWTYCNQDVKATQEKAPDSMMNLFARIYWEKHTRSRAISVPVVF